MHLLFVNQSYLKSGHVVILPICICQHLDHVSFWVSGKKRHTQVYQGFDSFRSKHTQMPSNECTPIMTHNKRLFTFTSYGIKKPNQVAYQMVDGELGVVIHWCTHCVTIATEVWCHSSVAMICKIQNLVAPGVPQLREAMEEQD